MDNAIIDLVDVSIAFDNRVVLSGVTFDVKQGEALCITGPSGSGKTVLLKLCAGLLTPTTGTIRQTPLKKSSVPGAGFVFEYGGLLSNMTVFNNVALPLRYHTDLSQERIASEVYAILAKLRMMVFADEIPARLSLGTRKLASIARAIAMRPQIIYYDEPTLGLDRAAARAVETVMRETCKEHGVTSVAVTHDVELGCRFADRVVILGDGVMRGIGTPAELAASRDPRIQSYLARE